MNWIQRRLKEAEAEDHTTLDLSLPRLAKRGADSLDILTAIPAEVFQLTHLESLDLSGHSLTVVPAEIARLTNLKHLFLQGNRGISLPVELAKLPLRTLNVSDVSSAISQYEFASLTQLTDLDLGWNDLDTLPTGIAALRHLTAINTLGNPLKLFPQGLLRLPFLSDIAIQFRTLEAGAPLLLSRFERLKNLWLSLPQAPIHVIEDLLSIPSLAELTLIFESMPQVPKAWSRSSNLTSLGLYSIATSTKPATVGSLASISELSELTSLSLSGLSLNDIIPRLRSFNKLRYLSLTDAPVEKWIPDQAALRGLEYLTLTNCGLTSVHAGVASLATLTSLRLDRNPVRTLPVDIGLLPRLRELSIARTRIHRLPTSVSNLATLEHLDCEECGMTSWPNDILNLKRLQTLDLSKNQIDYIPPQIRSLSNLRELYLDGNPIRQLPKEAARLPQLRALSVDADRLVSPPPEIANRGTAAIQGYFSAIESEDTTYLFEAKLVVVGEGEVGKTWLAHRLIDPARHPMVCGTSSTKGIDVLEWSWLRQTV